MIPSFALEDDMKAEQSAEAHDALPIDATVSTPTRDLHLDEP
jgi:hypothetical protein